MTVAALVPAALCASRTEVEAASRQPNVIFILADDMGYGDVSALNPQSGIKTPNIDRLARSGAVFTDAHSSSSVSTPSRYAVLTGRYAWRTTLKSGVGNGYSAPLIAQGRTTVASMLRGAGYHTACIGKWHLGWTWHGVERGIDSVDFTKPIQAGPTTAGFDYFYGISASLDMPPYVYVENDRVTAPPDRETESKGLAFWRKGPTGADFRHGDVLENLISRAETYISERARSGKPFFLYLPLPAPHTPIIPSAAFEGRSGLNAYADFVMMVDAMVGRIAGAADKAGAARNTMIVFTADNGCSPAAHIPELEAAGHFPSYIYRGHKADLFEGGHRVPCIVNWPGTIEQHRIDQTVCLTDFMATIASATGCRLKDNEGEDSFDLLPLFAETASQRPIREYTVHHSINGSFTIRSGRWKLLFAPDSGGWSYPRPGRNDEYIATLPSLQLYNMENDPGERNNVFDTYPEVAGRLRGAMISAIKNGRTSPGKPQNNDSAAKWRQAARITGYDTPGDFP